MTRQVLRRLLLAVPLGLAATFLAFLLSRLSGGSYFDALKTDRRYDPAQIRALERQARLDRPLVVQYLYWLRGVCFDVRIGRPRRELQGFEEPLTQGRDWSATPGVMLRSSGDETHAGRRAARIDVDIKADATKVDASGPWLRVELRNAVDLQRAGVGLRRIEFWCWSATRTRMAAALGPLEDAEGAASFELAPGAWTRVDLPAEGLALPQPGLELRFEPGRLGERTGPWYLDEVVAVEDRWSFSCGAPDFGRSFRYDTPVFTLLLPAFANSALLAIAALLVTFGLAIPLGVLAAWRRDGWIDRALSAVSFTGLSVPGFFLALLALYAVVEWLQRGPGAPLVPVGSDRSADHESLSLAGRLLDRAHHLLLPALVLAAGSFAAVQRTLRGQMVETLRQPFVTVAWAKGLSERRVLLHHALRNAMHPIIALFGIRFSELLSGAALVEIVFQYPGLGRLVLDATVGRDLHVVTGAVLLGCLVLVGANLLSDVALAWLDPRIDLARARP